MTTEIDVEAIVIKFLASLLQTHWRLELPVPLQSGWKFAVFAPGSKELPRAAGLLGDPLKLVLHVVIDSILYL